MAALTTTTTVELMKSQELAPKDLARRRGYTVKYVYDLLAAGRVPGARKLGKRWSIPARALEHLSRKKRVREADSVAMRS
jgi:hypothetical protein